MAYSWAIEDYDRFRAKSWPAATSDHDGPDDAKIRHGLAKGNEDMPDDNTAAATPAVMPSLPDGDRHLTASEVAQMVGLNETTLRDYRSTRGRRYGPPFHKHGKKVLYRLSEVLDWIDSRVTHHGGRYDG